MSEEDQFEADAEAEEMFRVLCSSDECTGDVMESFAAAVKGQITTLEPNAFVELLQSGSMPCVDARSPKEYGEGHIPGACSLPLFSNDERAEVPARKFRCVTSVCVRYRCGCCRQVGTLYKNKGRTKAMTEGMGKASQKHRM